MFPARNRSFVAPMMFLLIGAVVASNPADGADQPLEKPASWAEFTAYLVDGGDLGWWEASGVTTNVWKTLPAGIRYRYRAQTRLDVSGRMVVRAFTYVDGQGNLLSSGSETIVWDAKSKNVIWSVSGFDADQPWSDSGRLVGYDDSKMVVSSMEEAAGESYELRTTIERTGENTRRRTVARADGTETPFVQDFTRVNHFVEALAGWDPTGTWTTDMDGVTFVNDSRWSADRRCVTTTEGVRLPDGSLNVTGNGIMWFDPVAGVIRQRYVSSSGMMLEGEVSAISKDRVAMHYTGVDGAGIRLDAIVTRTRKGDALTTTFSDMRYDGQARMPAWAREPMVAKLERK